MVTGPLKPLDAETVEKLELPGWCLSKRSLAAQLGMSYWTLHRRCEEDAKVATAVKTVLAEQRRKAEDMSTKLLMERMKGEGKEASSAHVWFDKSRLGYSDRVTNVQEGDINVNINRSEIPMPEPPKEASADSQP
jgi:hypothetical protein